MTTLAENLLRSRAEAPNRMAIRLLQGDEALELDFGTLVAGAARFASALNRAGVVPGEVVVILLEHGRDLIESFFGAILHGAIPSIMPFLTEEVWQQLPHEGDSLMVAPWPSGDAGAIDSALDRQMEMLMSAVGTIRSLRAELGIPPSQRIPVRVRAEATSGELLAPLGRHFTALGRTEPLAIEPLTSARPAGSVTAVLSGLEISIPLAGLVDPAKERGRLARALRDLEAELGGLLRRLDNPDFVQRAPADVVARERARAEDLRARRQRLGEIAAALGDDRAG